MIRSHDIIFKCPNCGNHYITFDVLSYNTFGAKFYSDGRVINNMMPDHTKISKCEDCDTIFWVHDFYSNQILNIAENMDDRNSSSKASYPKFLNIYDNFKILENGFIKGKDQEFYIREQIWWKFNDRIRMNEPIFQKDNDEQLYRDNLLKLRKLIPRRGCDNLISIAEICRNLGEFENCINYLESISDDNYSVIQNLLIKESQKQNPYVIEIR